MKKQRGFTLLEVMIALAILASAMVVLLSISSGAVRASHKAKMLTIATGLARSKMYDLESQLMKDGFQDTDQDFNGDFSEEGQAAYTWVALVEKVTLPSLGDVQNAEGQKDKDKPIIPPSASDEANQDNISALAGGDAMGALGAGMVQLYFPLIAPVLEQAIRKVSLTVTWHIGNDEETLKVICFYTDTKAIDNAMKLAGPPPPDTPPPPPPK